MSKFICGIVVAAASVVVGIAGVATLPAAASPECMTQEEARKAFPRDHLYWHGLQKCWDNVRRRRAPAADAASAPDAVQSTPSQAAKPRKPATEPSAASGSAPPVPFIGDDPSRAFSWAALSWAALAGPARAQGDDAPAASPPPTQRADGGAIAVGAAGAAPGSPDYLLEHCCWPPTIADGLREDTLLPRMVVASASACGLAVGLWLFVYRRRRPARLRWS